MLSDVLFGCLKQICHKLLGQPDRLILEAHIDFDLAVFRFIDEELAHAEIGAVSGYQVFAHDCTASSMSCSTRILAWSRSSFASNSLLLW